MVAVTRRENPYIERKAIRSPDSFFGRTAELTRVYEFILGTQSVSLVGERRIGKSSILNALTFPDHRRDFGVPDDVEFVPVDFQSIAGCSLSLLMRHLWSRITGQAAATSPADGDPCADDVRSTLESAVRQTIAHGRRLVLLLDEFEALVFNEQIPSWFYDLLRGVTQEFQVGVVIVSREGTIEPILNANPLTSPFINLFQSVYVGPLEQADALDLVRAPAQRVGVDFDDAEVEWITALAGRHPFFLQFACYHAFDLKEAGLRDQAWREQVQEAFMYDVEPHVAYLVDGLPEGEKAHLYSLVQNGSVPPSSDRRGDRVKANLRRKGLYIETDGRLRPFSAVLDVLLPPRRDRETA
jgi:hypothetical protein